MATEQVNLRLRPDLVAAIERLAEAESLDRATMVRRLLEEGVARRRLELALRRYQAGQVSLGRAAEEAGVTQWELIEASRAAGIAYPLDGGDVAERIAEFSRPSAGRAPGGDPPLRGHQVFINWRDESVATLGDLPPAEGGILLIGINPAPVSVAAGHYYQGNLGRRLWSRLERLDLLDSPVPGAEDDAFLRRGHGITDLVKRPTARAAELTQDELREGATALIAKVREWRPRLLLFAFKGAADTAHQESVDAGPGPALAGVPTFLLSGPYARRQEAERIDDELRALIAGSASEGIA